jgi:hypothetical protein
MLTVFGYIAAFLGGGVCGFFVCAWLAMASDGNAEGWD